MSPARICSVLRTCHPAILSSRHHLPTAVHDGTLPPSPPVREFTSCCRAHCDAGTRREQIPFAPTDVSVTVVSGTRVEVFFCDPLISSGDIWGFLVQWDSAEDFTNAIAGGDTGENSADRRPYASREKVQQSMRAVRSCAYEDVTYQKQTRPKSIHM